MDGGGTASTRAEVEALASSPRLFDEPPPPPPPPCGAEPAPPPATSHPSAETATRGYACWCCNEPAALFLTPAQVFCCGHVADASRGALAALAAIGGLLQKNPTEARRRLAVCRDVACLLRQQVLTPDHRLAWLADQTRRPQSERGSARKGAHEMCENSVLLHVVAKAQALPPSHVQALFKHFIAHSPFVRERARRFEATALSATDRPDLLGFRFADAGAVVRAMARFPANYCEAALFAHIADRELSPFRWQAKLRVILESGFPKPADALYTAACVQNVASCGRDDRGNLRHCCATLAAANAFRATAFGAGLAACAGAAPQHALGGWESRQTRAACSVPTCGSLQADSGVHTAHRYRSSLHALGVADDDADAVLPLFVQRLASGNAIGFEKQRDGRAKACSALRMPEVTCYHPHANPTRKRLQSECGALRVVKRRE